MAESNPNTAEKILTRLLKESKQQGRKLVAEKTFAAETVGVRGPRRQFHQIVKTISEGDENVATGYKKQMIASVKSIEAENLPGNVFRDGVKQIISDIMKVVNADVLLAPEAKSDVQDVANQLMRYADSRGKVGVRAAATAAGLAKRVRSSLADSLSGKRSFLLRGLGYLLKAPDRKEARAQSIADARLDATQGALDNRARGKYDPELMRSAASRIRGGADPVSPEGKVLVDIRTGINKLVAASDRTEDEHQSDREDASLKDEEGEVLPTLFSNSSPTKLKAQTGSGIMSKLSSLSSMLPILLPILSEMLPILLPIFGVLGVVALGLYLFMDKLAEFVDSFGAIKTELVSLFTRGEHASTGVIRDYVKEQIENAQKLGAEKVEYPTGEMGFDDRNLAIKSNFGRARRFNAEIARLNTVTPGGISHEAAADIIKGYYHDSDGNFVRPARDAGGQSLPSIDTRPASMRPGFVESGTEDAWGSEDRPTSTSPTRTSTYVDAQTLSMSEGAIQSLKEHEAYRPSAYPDPPGQTERYAIGYGETSWGGKPTTLKNPGREISEPEADAQLRMRIKNEFEPTVRNAIKRRVTQNQFDALTHLAYNSPSGARKIIAKMNVGGAPTQADFMSATERQLPKRRKDEFNMYIEGAASALPSSSNQSSTPMTSMPPASALPSSSNQSSTPMTSMPPPTRSAGQLDAETSKLNGLQQTINFFMNTSRNPPAASTQSIYLPVAVNARDDSRQAINTIHAV